MIVELLSEGKENKKDSESLMKVLGIRNKRDFYTILRNERRAGHLIISDKESGGYWLWDGKDYNELNSYYKMQRSGAIDTLVTLKPVYRILKDRKIQNQG